MEATIGILATASYLPPTRKSVQQILDDEQVPEGPFSADIDFRKDIGIDAVHLAGEESAAEMAIKAVSLALEESGTSAKEIDLIVDFTSIPEDYPAPTWSAAGLVQHEIGATDAFATAVNTGGCASYHVALRYALAMMKSDPRLSTALLFASDKTPPLNKAYYPITVTCDGATAVLLRRGHDQRRILSVELLTAGDLHDVWYIPGLGRVPANTEPTMDFLHMHSDLDLFRQKVIPINLFMFRRVIRNCLKRAGFKSKDVAHYVYPSFSTWDQSSFCRGLSIDPDKVYLDGLKARGHVQENDMILNFQGAEQEGRYQPGELVVVTTNGAGFTWGAALIQY